jgi:probable phosphoglycerate mutase
MAVVLPRLFLVRHGNTAWSETGQHTGRTDLPLNEVGERRARRVGEYLKTESFARVFTSPLQRASKTCALAGFAQVAVVDADLVEWDYGAYEGKLTKEILAERPGWNLFRDGCPGGELLQAVAMRADRFLAKVRGCEGNVLAFSSGHIIRVITARWLGLPPEAGRHFVCAPGSIGVLGFEHHCLDEPMVERWNCVLES